MSFEALKLNFLKVSFVFIKNLNKEKNMKNYFTGKGINLRSHDSEESVASIAKETDQRKENIAKSIDKLMSFSLFMIFFGLPLFFTGLAFQGVVFEKQIYFYFWALLALVSWAAKGVILGKMKIRRTPLDIPIVAFWLTYVISTVFSVDRWHSIWGFFGDPSRGLMNVTAIIVIYYLIMSNFTKERMRLMIGGLVSAGIILSLWSLILFMGIDIVPDKIKPFIPFNIVGTSTGLKLLFGAMIPLIILFLFEMDTEKSRLKKITSYVLLAFVPINIFLTSILFDKTGAIIILIGVGIFLLYILSNIVRPKDKMTWVPMVAFVLVMIALMVGRNNISRVDIPLEVSPNAKISWEIAKGSLKENAFLGSGPATYGYNFSMFKPQEFNNNVFFELRFYQATGLFFEALSTIGVIGLVAFLIVTIAFINVSIYLVSKDKEKNKIYSLSLFSAVLILMAGSLFLRVEGTILIIGGLLGALALATIFWESGVEEKSVKLSFKASPKFALTLAFIFIMISSGVAALFVYIGRAYVADILAGKSLREPVVSENSVSNVVKAVSLNNKEGRYYSRASQEFMVLANNEALKPEEERDINFIRDNINNALAYGKAGVENMPNDALAIAVLAQIYENAGLYVSDTLNDSIETYNKILEVEPHNPIAYMKAGQIKITIASMEQDEVKREELIKEAKDLLETAIEKKPSLDAAHYYLAIAQNALGDKKESIISMSNAVSINPNNITYLFNLGRLYQDRNEGDDSENARKIFEYILTVNPDEINTNFSLGLIYERANEDSKAIEKYRKVLSLVTGDGENEKNTREQLEKMISNVQSGISNEGGVQEQVNIPQEEEQVQPEEIELIEANNQASQVQGPAEASQEEEQSDQPEENIGQ
jgi:tetratricopeptide (TPR) repeat protein